ncbi:receptor-type tyrosine-protein phosphatase S-like [Stylophora pistillata]|uniref:receptor-type tyrosine-protein phosphatase S-like n=1 Tax=Stylophora pistillata TaxID=50429 RepID=UPI000C048F51|nr:receptor-type tyrosine-protein phosphatase S-like [Stylophora pistillata]
MITHLADGYVRFIAKPDDPSYVKKGRTAKLVWDYKPYDQPTTIVLSVAVQNTYVPLLAKQNGSVTYSPNTPSAYMGRVKLEGRATMVIDNTSIIINSRLKQSQRSYANQPHFTRWFLFILAEPPKINLSSLQGSYREGSFVNISCTASGIPEPDVTWIKDGIVIGSRKRAAFLIFKSIRRTDDGWYLCRANNTVGIITNHTTLIVYHPPTIRNITTSSSKSGIGQTVTMKCFSNGVPTPTLTWYKPDGSEINKERARETEVHLKLMGDQDFGDYKCNAVNGLSPSDERVVKITQINRPGPPIMGLSDEGIQANSLTVRWTAPANDGGSPITGYQVVMLKGDTEINNINITDPGTARYTFGGLERDINYAVKVFARNTVFEGEPVVATLKTKFEGPPVEVKMYDLPSETTDHAITLKWKEPEDYGKVIIQYTVYQRIVTNGKLGKWTVVGKITDILIKEVTVKLKRGKVYEFVITATNELGESLKEETMIKRVKVIDLQNNNKKVLEECKCSCHCVMLIAIIGVLVFLILVLFTYIVWLHKKGKYRYSSVLLLFFGLIIPSSN